MTFIPPYTNTHRTITTTLSNGVANVTIHVPFDVDEIIFKYIALDFPSSSQVFTLFFTCPELTTGESDASIAFAQYSGITDTAYTSGMGDPISYMYNTPRFINGRYCIRASNEIYSGNFMILIEFRKYN